MGRWRRVADKHVIFARALALRTVTTRSAVLASFRWLARAPKLQRKGSST